MELQNLLFVSQANTEKFEGKILQLIRYHNALSVFLHTYTPLIYGTGETTPLSGKSPTRETSRQSSIVPDLLPMPVALPDTQLNSSSSSAESLPVSNCHQSPQQSCLDSPRKLQERK